MSEKEYIFVGTAQLKTRDYIKYLEKENRDLQQRIDKAIEYIHWRYDDREDMYITQMEELLEILGDKE